MNWCRRANSSAAIVLMSCVLASWASAQPAGAATCPALGPKALIGIAGGGAVGAGLGAAVAKNKGLGALIGGVAGAALGGIVGKTMDQRDCEQAQVALRQAATVPTGQQIAWNSPATGNHGTFTPVSDPATNPNGQTCRQYKRDSIIGGQQTGGDIGIVCRTPDGDYQSVQ